MTHKALLTSLFLFIIFVKSQSQDYSTYYSLINRAEEQFVLKKDNSCFQDYDIAFKDYQPFLKDPYIASQIALYLGDTSRFYKYLSICFQNGMPLTAVNASPLIKSVIDKNLSIKLSELFKKYYKSIVYNEAIKDKISLYCYQSDSFKVEVGGRSPEFYHNEYKTRKYILDSFLLQGKFPNEKLFGISSNQDQNNFHKKHNRKYLYPISNSQHDTHFEEFELRLKCPFNIILHSRCFYREYKQLFLEAMLDGYIHPKEIGILEETSIIWYQSGFFYPAETCGKSVPGICYNIFSMDPRFTEQIFSDTEEGLKTVESNRARIYMQKYSIDQKKKQLEKETGIKFFFDFADR